MYYLNTPPHSCYINKIHTINPKKSKRNDPHADILLLQLVSDEYLRGTALREAMEHGPVQLIAAG